MGCQQDLPAPLQRLHRVLLRVAGSDRVMALVPSAGLEAGLVAVELALRGHAPRAA